VGPGGEGGWGVGGQRYIGCLWLLGANILIPDLMRADRRLMGHQSAIKRLKMKLGMD